VEKCLFGTGGNPSSRRERGGFRERFPVRRRKAGCTAGFFQRPDPLDTAMGEADGVLDPGTSFRRVDRNIAVMRPLDIAVRSPSTLSGIPHQPAVAGDRVMVKTGIQVLRLELQVLVPCIRQWILAVDGIEETHANVLPSDFVASYEYHISGREDKRAVLPFSRGPGRDDILPFLALEA
jgi:hypothetical protein